MTYIIKLYVNYVLKNQQIHLMSLLHQKLNLYFLNGKNEFILYFLMLSTK
jgi:hypothetical protein